MLIILTIVAILMIMLGVYMMARGNYDHANGGLLITLLFAGALIIIIIFDCCLINNVLEGRIIDQKIEIYQEENINIESDLDTLIQSYMDHEQKVMWAAEGGSPVTLINLYPDLKADTLVQRQIDIYVENNNNIRALKERKLDVSASKWWLYFGK